MTASSKPQSEPFRAAVEPLPSERFSTPSK